MTVRVVETPKYQITVQNNGKSVDVDSGKKLTVNLAGIVATGAGGSAAPANATYVCMSGNSTLTNERILTGTAKQVIITDGGAGNPVTLSTPQDLATNSAVVFDSITATTTFIPFGQTLTSISTGAASNTALVTKGYVDDADIIEAPTNATYLTLSTNAVLTSERVLTGTANQVILTDAGANNALTLSTPQDLATNSAVVFDSVTATTTFVPFGQSLTSISTGAASNTALVTKGYVDDNVALKAPSNATFVTLSTNDALTSERVLTGTANQVIITDGGANAAVTLSTPQDIATNSAVTFTSVQINTSPGVIAHSEGLIHWNTDDSTMEIGMAGDVNLQVGQEILLRGKAIGANHDNGQVVYVSGSSGTRPEVTLARADALATSRTAIAVATEDITQNNNGFYTTYGFVRDIDTSGFTEGAAIYLDASTAGAFTETAPTDPNFSIRIGYVVRAHATLGSIFVDIQGGNPVYNRNFGMTATAVPFAGANGFMTEDATGFNFIAATDRLGLGQATPAAQLHTKQDSATHTVPGVIIENVSANAAAQSRLDLFNSGGNTVGTNGSSLFYMSAAAAGGYANALGFWNYSAGPILMATSNTERMRILSTGYVGIGETNPTVALVVKSPSAGLAHVRAVETVDTTDSHYCGFEMFDNTQFKGGILKDGATHRVQVWNSSGPQITVLQTTGYVGIGTEDPVKALHVASSTNNTYIQCDPQTDGDCYLLMSRAISGNKVAVTYRTGGVSQWFTGITDADTADVDGDEFFIGQDGGGDMPAVCIDPDTLYVGINEPAPTQRLHITGDTNDVYIELKQETGGKDTGIIYRGVNYNFTAFADDSQGRFRWISGNDLNFNFFDNGSIGIGSTTKPTANPKNVLFMAAADGNPTLGASTAGLYAKTSNSVVEMFAMDSTGNVTQLSSHDSSGDWIYYSENMKTGKKVRIDLEKFFREKFPEYVKDG